MSVIAGSIGNNGKSRTNDKRSTLRSGTPADSSLMTAGLVVDVDIAHLGVPPDVAEDCDDA